MENQNNLDATRPRVGRQNSADRGLNRGRSQESRLRLGNGCSNPGHAKRKNRLGLGHGRSRFGLNPNQ